MCSNYPVSVCICAVNLTLTCATILLQTILSSATLPRIEEVPSMVSLYKTRHPTAEILSITSNRIGIGCHAIHTGVTIFPFEGCKNVADLVKILDLLAHNPFMFRLLSIEVVVTLRNRMGDIKENVEDWANIFPDPSCISHQVQYFSFFLFLFFIRRNTF